MGESDKPLHFTGGLRVKAEFFNSSSLDTGLDNFVVGTSYVLQDV